MKINIYLLITLMAFANSLFSQIPNNGFENWTNMGGYNTPDDWGNLNPVTNMAGVYTCLKGTPGNPGTAYLKLTSATVTGLGVQPGIAVSGVLNTSTFQAISGFAYTNRPAVLNGTWQYMANGDDQGYISIYLTKWNTSMNMRDTVGQVMYYLPGMVMSWENFSIPISYSRSEVPDSAMIILSASGHVPENGSYLYLDDLSFAGGTVGLENHTDMASLIVYPDPVIGNKVLVSLKNADFVAGYLDIVDLQGKMISRTDIKNPGFPVSIDVSTLQSGEYFLRMTSLSGNFVGKFIKK